METVLCRNIREMNREVLERVCGDRTRRNPSGLHKSNGTRQDLTRLNVETRSSNRSTHEVPTFRRLQYYHQPGDRPLAAARGGRTGALSQTGCRKLAK